MVELPTKMGGLRTCCISYAKEERIKYSGRIAMGTIKEVI